MRKPSPISISSPAADRHLAPARRAPRAPASPRRRCCSPPCRPPRPSARRGSARGGRGATRGRRRRGRTRGWSTRRNACARSIAAAGSGARPRFVCTTTPVAFNAGRRLDGRSRCCAARSSSSLGALGDPVAAGVGERRADRLHGRRAPVALGERDRSLVPEKGVDRRQASQRMIGHGAILTSTRAEAETPDPLRHAVVRPPPAATAASAAAPAGHDRGGRGLCAARHSRVRDPPAVAAHRSCGRRNRRPGAHGAGRSRRRRPQHAAAGAARRRRPGGASVPGRRAGGDRGRPDDGSRALPEARPPPASRSRASRSS